MNQNNTLSIQNITDNENQTPIFNSIELISFLVMCLFFISIVRVAFLYEWIYGGKVKLAEQEDNIVKIEVKEEINELYKKVLLYDEKSKKPVW